MFSHCEHGQGDRMLLDTLEGDLNFQWWFTSFWFFADVCFFSLLFLSFSFGLLRIMNALQLMSVAHVRNVPGISSKLSPLTCTFQRGSRDHRIGFGSSRPWSYRFLPSGKLALFIHSYAIGWYPLWNIEFGSFSVCSPLMVLAASYAVFVNVSFHPKFTSMDFKELRE